MTDPRALAAKFYDLAPGMPADLPFYLRRLPSSASRVLELGCGTGRVSVPLARHCTHLHGIDHSQAMLEICRAKLRAAGIRNAEATLGDIADFHLGSTFDFVIAPYRVLQNLESDSQVSGLFAGIREHLRPGGRCILNTFRIGRSLEDLIARWSSKQEEIDWEVARGNERFVCHACRAGIQLDPLVLRPVHTYRHYSGGTLVDEASLTFVMRCYDPDEFLALIRREGFRITETFGGYDGETFGEGNELVVEFEAEA
jgi:SAM-dependent methyltransferase